MLVSENRRNYEQKCHNENCCVHRDVKPSNIIFLNDAPRFADIGLVTDIGEAATFVGTEGYVPPEGPGKPLADIYGLGKVLYEMITGKDVRDFPEFPTMADGATNPRLEQFYHVVLQACHLSPARRFQSGQILHDTLTELIATTPRTGAGHGNIASPPPVSKPSTVALIADATSPADVKFAAFLREHLAKEKFVLLPDSAAAGVEWARRVEERAAQADVIIVVISVTSAESELLFYEIDLARDTAQQRQGKPRLVGVSMQDVKTLPEAFAGRVELIASVHGSTPQDQDQAAIELIKALQAGAPAPAPRQRPKLETVGGAVPLDSMYYVVREADEEFESSIAKHDSIVLVKGARQMGKTSLLARGLQLARDRGFRVILTDFQKLNVSAFDSIEKVYTALSHSIVDQLDLDTFIEDTWDVRRSANSNFERYLRREVLAKISPHLVWGMDEVDRLFGCPFSSEVFGLLRSWHNDRALDPSGPWSRLTMTIAYATEAHLFISDMNQSPFNVGTRLALGDFSRDQVAELNLRCGNPLPTPADVDQFVAIVGGQPFLVRKGLNEIAKNDWKISTFETEAVRDEGMFADHLRRIHVLLTRDSGMIEVVKSVLTGKLNVTSEQFYRLRSAGVMTGDTQRDLKPRCLLYERYLRRHLLEEA